MERETVRALLVELRDTIRAAREHAKALDMEAMLVDVRRKEDLLRQLSTADRLHPDDRHFALEVQRENRRNAYLFRATLNWIQETMEFFGRKTVPATYSPRGVSQNAAMHGRLLSGRI